MTVKFYNVGEKMEIRKNENIKKVIVIVILLLVAIISFKFVGDVLSKPSTYKATLNTLNEKRDNVIAMTASTTALSAGISAIPGDFGTSIADQLANLSSTLMIVLCAIFLEKYLLVIAGTLLCKVIVPLCCAVFIYNIISKKDYFRNFVIKLLIFGICLVSIVPVTTYATNLIEDTYSISIEENIEKADKISDDIEDKDAGFWEKATSSVSNMKNKVKNAIGNFIENAAILIITSCVFPIITFVFLIYIAKNIFNLNIVIPRDKLTGVANMGSRVRKKITKSNREGDV